MRPIRDITAVKPATVLYHSAFGFARVVAVEPHRLVLEWEARASNLPVRVTHEVVQRVYALCNEGGFFHQALHAPDGLKKRMETEGLSTLFDLLSDLNGSQSRNELRQWVIGRNLMSPEAFGHWFAALEPVINEDERFEYNGSSIGLAKGASAPDPLVRLNNPLLGPGRRLDLALQHRTNLDDKVFFEQVMLAWRTGGTQVRDLALVAMGKHSPDDILCGLLQDGPDSVDALIHAIRRSGWTRDQVDGYTQQLLVDRVIVGLDSGGPVDNEGRLAATLLRWECEGMIETLGDVVSSSDGKRLIRATFAALPPRRGERVALALLQFAIRDADTDTAQWLGGEVLAFALVEPEEIADRIEEEFPDLAHWFLETFQAVSSKPLPAEYTEDSSHDSIYSAEIEFSETISQPMALSDLPPRSGSSLLGLGLALSRALAAQHKDGHVCNPTAQTVRVMPNETMEVQPSGDNHACPRPLIEQPSQRSDVYAAAVLLLESILGRPWPRNVPAHRAMAYLRTCISMLPPSALAPLDAALHPDPLSRPANALQWVALWQAAAVAEENRAYTSHNPAGRTHVGFDSHIGRMKIQVTQTNQDSIFISTKGPLSMLLVCDGISTANAGSGDVASSIASHVMANLWEQALPRLAQSGPSEIREFLDRALRMANTAVCEAALRFAGGNLDGRVPMGTTAVCALIHGNHVSLAWLGDSRAYLVGSFGASLLTADENQAGERLKAWHLKFLENWDPAGFALVGYLGHFDEMCRPEALPAHHLSFTLLEGERLVLCTDGVTDYIGETHPEVARLISESCQIDDPDEVARALVAHSNRGGGGDNTTCLVAHLWTP